MREGWREVVVEDVAQVIGGGTPKSNVEGYWGGEIPWLTPKDLSERPSRYTTRGTRNITQAGLDRSGARLLPKGTVLLTSRAPVGYVSVAANAIATNQGFKSLILDGTQLPEFWYYLLGHSTDYLRANSGGSTFQELSGSALKKLRFTVPPLKEQRRIVDLMGALDDTIAAAQRTLEQTSSVLDHFPASLVARGRAEGWNEEPLGEVLGGKQAIRTGPFGSQLHKSDYVQDGPVAVVMPTDMKNGRVLRNTAAKINQEDADRLARHITREGDILWSRRGDVTRFAVIDAESAGSLCGTGCFLLRPTDPADTEWLEVLLSAPETGQWLIDRAVGATMANLNRSILGAIPVLVPPRDERTRLVASWMGLRTMEQQLLEVTDHLQSLRSNVLTALLSGEHEIPESYDAAMGELVETAV
ncbi:restriction endonuclease subunit S [Citricoccus nitrophenolicus]|uniref:Restriction endonuclease subunit S n=1 Tax=Citricoccus nitrophenolicus TaxID=863575 RepID=A0ABV0ILU8_9MICC